MEWLESSGMKGEEAREWQNILLEIAVWSLLFFSIFFVDFRKFEYDLKLEKKKKLKVFKQFTFNYSC